MLCPTSGGLTICSVGLYGIRYPIYFFCHYPKGEVVLRILFRIPCPDRQIVHSFGHFLRFRQLLTEDRFPRSVELYQYPLHFLHPCQSARRFRLLGFQNFRGVQGTDNAVAIKPGVVGGGHEDQLRLDVGNIDQRCLGLDVGCVHVFQI